MEVSVVCRGSSRTVVVSGRVPRYRLMRSTQNLLSFSLSAVRRVDSFRYSGS